MLKEIIAMFGLILFIDQMTQIFGKLTIIRGPIHYNKTKMLCASKEDGSALIWSFYESQHWPPLPINNKEAEQFHSSCHLNKSQIDCRMDSLQGCLNQWNIQQWKFTNSMNTPMGAVLDQRWEEFKEYVYDDESTNNVILDNTHTIILPFSIRSSQVHILICNKEYEDSLCYSIRIGLFEIVIQKCPTGVPTSQSNLLPNANKRCETQYSSESKLYIYGKKWETFVLTWNSQTRNISLYNPNQLIVIYEDTDKFDNMNLTYKMFIKSFEQTLIRYHHYDYFYTDKQYAVLTSNMFNLNTTTVCLQMVIGLCKECDADILLRDAITNKILHNVTVKGLSAAVDHGLPMWQFVKIMTNLKRVVDNLRIEMIPKLNSTNVNPVWAIANVRQCPPKGCLRLSSISVKLENLLDTRLVWPYGLVCQKLFYKQQFSINFDGLHTFLIAPSVKYKPCAFGYVGPACQINCQSTFKTESGCKQVAICDKFHSCYCTPGYVYPQCEKTCSDNYSYGFYCNKRCGLCSLGEPCNETSGECREGCSNTEHKIYAPPLCQIGVGKPNKAEIVSTTETTITLIAPIKWEKEYEETELTYSYKIKTLNNSFEDQQQRKKIFANTSRLIGVFTNLQPATTYYIVPILSFDKTEIYGTWQVVRTKTVLLTVPSNVLNLRAIPLSTSKVKLVWTSPDKPNGIIEGYAVHLQLIEYFGCRDYGQFTTKNPVYVENTNKTNITIAGLHPYANYSVQVVAYNSQYSSTATITYFITNMTDIPAATFSQLKIQGWKLSWDPPENCTAMLGPISATKVEIRGINNNVTNHNFVISNDLSVNLHDDLYGAERYVAKVYALRGRGLYVNSSAYEELEFVTPSKEPPEVTNLVVIEVDTRQIPANIHLKWQSPHPPFNGMLRNYGILFGDVQKQHNTISVHLNEFCSLWDNYICKTVPHITDDIQVVAYNFGVPKPSLPVHVTMKMIRNITPDAPRDFKFAIHENSLVYLEWLHPRRTGNHLCCFRILIKKVLSTLRSFATQSSKNETYEYAVTNYTRKYNKLLYLWPSTRYNISIQTVTIANQSSNTSSLEVLTSSNINLDGDLRILNMSDSSITLRIPKVQNDTSDSVTYVAVIGPNICEPYKKLPSNLLAYVGKTEMERIWQVAKRPTDELVGKEFIISNDKAANCPLKDGESYNVMIIITLRDISGDRVILTRKTSIYFGKPPPRYTEVWIIITIIIFGAGSAACYFYKE